MAGITELERELSYYESELGGVLVIETSGTAYGVIRDIDRKKILTAQTLSQIGTRDAKVK
jgi:hypothetical protein